MISNLEESMIDKKVYSKSESEKMPEFEYKNNLCQNLYLCFWYIVLHSKKQISKLFCFCFRENKEPETHRKLAGPPSFVP